MLHHKQTLLQDYFPSGLAELINQATIIKPKVFQRGETVILLTASGRLFEKKGDSFKLFHNEPVQHVEVRDFNIWCITLDAEIIVLSTTGIFIQTTLLENVTTIGWSRYLVATTNDGSLFEYTGVDFKLISKEPVVAISIDLYQSGHKPSNLFLLTPDMKLLYYNFETEEVTVVPNVEDISASATELLVRVDGSIYEYHNPDLDTENGNEKFEFILNETMTNASIPSFQFVDSEWLNYAIITRTGELWTKSIAADMTDEPYKRVVTGGKVLAALPDLYLTVIRADGRVLTEIVNEDEIPTLTAIPRFNVFHK